MIKRQNGYVLKKIKGTAYLLPYGQNIADQKRGLIFNETGEVIWNFLDKEKTLEEIIEAVAAYYEIPVSDREELGKDVEEFVSQLLEMGILKEELKKGKRTILSLYEDWRNLYKTMRTGRHISKTVASFSVKRKKQIRSLR